MTIRSTIEPRPRLDWFARPSEWIRNFISAIARVFPDRVRSRAGGRDQHRVSAATLSLELGEILDGFADGFLILNSRLRVLFANTSVCQMVGATRRRVEGRSIDSLRWCNCLPGHRPWHDASLNSRRVNPSVRSADVDEQLIGYECEDGSRRLLAVTVREIGGHLTSGGMVISVRDATGVETYRAEMENLLARARHSREEMQQSNEELQQLVTEDALTGCRNRRCLDEQIDREWQTSEQEQRNLACMMFDIDHFKTFNDEHGHATGDEVLRQFGQTLRETFAGLGQVYRYGGEEFCIVLPGHDLSESRWIAERVRASVSRLTVKSTATEQPLQVTVSIGVTDRFAGAMDAVGMIDQADKCLYMAKRKGRDCVVAYGPEVVAAKFRTSDGGGGR